MPRSLDMQVLQEIFLVFYGIFWGAVFIGQSHWKAFHWPLFCFPPARHRILLSFFVLTVFPILFFAFAMWELRESPLRTMSSWIVLLQYTRAVIGAFAIFGFYRIWIGAIEICPETFYASDKSKIQPEYYQHVEPVFRQCWEYKKEGPVVYIGNRCTGLSNVIVGFFLYVGVLFFVLWWPDGLTALCKPFLLPAP